MKKLLAALLAAILAGSGLSIVDSELTNRVDVLEQQNIEQTSQIDELNKKIDELTSKVNEMQQNIPQGEKEYKVGDSITYKVCNEINNTKVFDEINVTATIIAICQDENSPDYYNKKYTLTFNVTGKANSEFFRLCKWNYSDGVRGYGCNVLSDKFGYITDIQLNPNGDYTFNVSQTIKCKEIFEDVIYTEAYWV